MSSPNNTPQERSNPAKLLLPWPEHTELTSTVPPNDWERVPHPKELQHLPDGEQTPYEIRQIVKRSLYERESESSNPPEVTAEVEESETQPSLAPKPLPGEAEKQRRESVTSANSFKTCSGGSEIASATPGDPASLLPGPLDAEHKARALKPKSSFFLSKFERLGAKIEKLEIVSSRRSSRGTEHQKHVETALVFSIAPDELRLTCEQRMC